MLFKNQKNIWWSWMMIWSLRQLRSVMPPDVEHDKLFGTTNNVHHHFPQSHCHLESNGNPSFKQWFIISFPIQIAMFEYFQCSFSIFPPVSTVPHSLQVLFEKVNRVFVQYDEGSCPQARARARFPAGNGLNMAPNHKGYIPIVVISIWLWLT